MTAALADTGTPLLEAVQEIGAVHAKQDALVATDVASMYAKIEGRPKFEPLLRKSLPIVIDRHANAAGIYTARWYDNLAPGAAYKAKPMFDIPREQIDKTIDWALNAPGEEPPVSRLAASSQRMVRNASRSTVTGNAAEEGVKWARYAKPTACAYCRALSIRGSGRGDRKYLYSSDKSAVYRSSDGEKYHTHCECEPVAIREGGIWVPPEYAQAWENEYNDAKGKTESGDKYFQRIVAQMRADEEERKKAEEEPEEAEAAALEPQAEILSLPTQPKAKPTPALDAEQEALRQKLDAATEWHEIQAVANELLPDTTVDLGDESVLRHAFYSTSDVWEKDLPEVQESAKAMIAAAHDIKTKYPALELNTVDITGVMMDGSPYAWTSYQGNRGPHRVAFNREHIANPQQFRESWDLTVDTGFHYPGEHPAYNVMVHEMGHVMEHNLMSIGIYLTNSEAAQVLASAYMQAHPEDRNLPVGDLLDAVKEWLAEHLSGYSTHSQTVQGPNRFLGPDLSTSQPINLPEALAEAFADVEINGGDASETSKVLHAWMVEHYAKFESEVKARDLPAAV